MPNKEFKSPQENFNLLHIAIYMGDVSTIYSLLVGGADINTLAHTHLNYTPLHFAVKLDETLPQNQINKSNILHLLLSHEQINVKAETIYGHTPLGLSLICNQYLSVLYLFNTPHITHIIRDDVENHYDFYVSLILKHKNPFLNIEFLNFVSDQKLNFHSRDLPDNVLMNVDNYYQISAGKLNGFEVDQLKRFLSAAGYDIGRLEPKASINYLCSPINDDSLTSSQEMFIIGSDDQYEQYPPF